MAVGFAAVAELSPVLGLHEYVTPLTAAAPIVAPLLLEEHVFVKSLPAAAVGVEVLTVAVTSSVSVHPVAVFVAVTVYV